MAPARTWTSAPLAPPDTSSTPAGQELRTDEQESFDASTIDHIHQPPALYLRGAHLYLLSLGVLTSKRIDRPSLYSPPLLALGFTVHSSSNSHSAVSANNKDSIR